MKFKDYFFVALMFIVLSGVISFFHTDPLTKERPVLAAVMKLAKYAGWAAWLLDEPPQDVEGMPEPHKCQVIPNELVNAYPERALDSSGEPQLDYGAGW